MFAVICLSCSIENRSLRWTRKAKGGKLQQVCFRRSEVSVDSIFLSCTTVYPGESHTRSYGPMTPDIRTTLNNINWGSSNSSNIRSLTSSSSSSQLPMAGSLGERRREREAPKLAATRTVERKVRKKDSEPSRKAPVPEPPSNVFGRVPPPEPPSDVLEPVRQELCLTENPAAKDRVESKEDTTEEPKEDKVKEEPKESTDGA